MIDVAFRRSCVLQNAGPPSQGVRANCKAVAKSALQNRKNFSGAKLAFCMEVILGEILPLFGES
jgi:hypothetical protein